MDYSKDLIKGTGDDALIDLTLSISHHGMGLTTTSLPICEYGPIVSFHHRLYQGKRALVIYFLLTHGLIEDVVELEIFLLFESDHAFLLVNIDDIKAVTGLL